MSYWLMKSEPTTFSIEDLKKAHQHTSGWEGVRNYQARNFMRDKMQTGDLAFFYHSSCKIPGIVGIMKIVKAAYPDPSAWDPNSPYYDPKSSIENPRWVQVDVQFMREFSTILPLSAIKFLSELKDFVLIRPGNRLSIMPVSPHEWESILKLEKK